MTRYYHDVAAGPRCCNPAALLILCLGPAPARPWEGVRSRERERPREGLRARQERAALARGLSRTRHGAGYFGIGCGLRPSVSVVSFQQTGFGGRESSVAVVVTSAKKQSLINVFHGVARRSSERCVTLRNSESRV